MDVTELYTIHKNRGIAKSDDTEALYKLYEALSSDEIHELLDLAMADDDIDEEDQIEIFLYLALYSYSCGDQLPLKMYDYLLENQLYSYSNAYGDVYLRANESVGIRPNTEKRKPTYTANEFTEISRTQIGGMPTAINDVFYPKCLECEKIMRFVAQFDMADMQEYGEGIYYFFTCDSCNVHVANYGQS
jgi:hypothetical protein